MIWEEFDNEYLAVLTLGTPASLFHTIIIGKLLSQII